MTEPDINKLNDAIMDALGSAACNPDIFKTAMRAKHDLLRYVGKLRTELEAATKQATVSRDATRMLADDLVALADGKAVKSALAEAVRVKLEGLRAAPVASVWASVETSLPDRERDVQFIIAANGQKHLGRWNGDDFVNRSKHCWRRVEVSAWSYIEPTPDPPETEK